MAFLCCKCGAYMFQGQTVITPWGLSPNLCLECLSEEQNSDGNPPRGLLIQKPEFESPEDLENCCKSAMAMSAGSNSNELKRGNK